MPRRAQVGGVKGCAYCGGLGHRVTHCPKLEETRRKTSAGIRDSLVGGGSRSAGPATTDSALKCILALEHAGTHHTPENALGPAILLALAWLLIATFIRWLIPARFRCEGLVLCSCCGGFGTGLC